MDRAKRLKQLYVQLETEVPGLPLATQAADIVPGEGNPNAEIFFIGEAPGYHESVQRRPFVGRSGQLLRQTIVKIGYQPGDVYIGNIVKARPPDNRDPDSAEIMAYKPYLDRELEIIEPLLVVTLGRLSMAKFLPEVRISQVHGRLHRVNWQSRQLFVLPMFHPAAALRNPQVKEQFTQDMIHLPKILEWIKTKKQSEVFEMKVIENLMS